MLKTTLLFFVVTLGLSAGTFTYNVSVDTSSLNNTTGTLYFQFDPGNVTSDNVTATISNFTGASLIGAPILSGGAVGTLPVFTIANSAALNDSLQAVSFGSALAFSLSLDETFTGTATAGSVFNFGLYQDDGFTPLLTTQVDGYSIIVNLDTLNGANAESTTSLATITASGVPEPGTMLLLSAGCAAVAVLGRRRVS